MKTGRAKLSKGILEMKFMKRTKAQVEKELFQEEGEEYFASQLPSNMKKDMGNFIMVPSYAYCEQLIDGRVSYQGMNPEIERLMEEEKGTKRKIEKVEEKTDVTEEEMAEKWSSLKKKMKQDEGVNGMLSQATHPREEVPKKKRKFLKPSD